MSYAAIGAMTIEGQSSRLAQEREPIQYSPPAPAPTTAPPPAFLTLPKLLTFPTTLFKLPTATPAPPTPSPVAVPASVWNVAANPYNPKLDQVGDGSWGYCDKGIFKNQWVDEFWVKNGKNCGTVGGTYWGWVRTHPDWKLPPAIAAFYASKNINPSIFKSSDRDEEPHYPVAMYFAGIRKGTIPPPPGFPMTKLPPQPAAPPATVLAATSVTVSAAPLVTKGMIVTTVVGGALGWILTGKPAWGVAGAAVGAGAGYALKGVLPF